MFEKNPESRDGTKFWWGLLAYIVVADTLGRETLSNAYKRGREHRIGRFAVRAAALYTLAHLEDAIPREWDLFDKTGEQIMKVGDKIEDMLESKPDTFGESR